MGKFVQLISRSLSDVSKPPPMACTAHSCLTQSMVDWLNNVTDDGGDALTSQDTELFNSVFKTTFVKIDLLNAWRRTMEHADFQKIKIYRIVLSRLRSRYTTMYATRRNTEANCSGVSPRERLEQMAAEEDASQSARSRSKSRHHGKKPVRMGPVEDPTETFLDTILETDSESIMNYIAGDSPAENAPVRDK